MRALIILIQNGYIHTRLELGFFSENLILGCGVGDLLDETKKRFESNYGRAVNKYPHNMYLFLLAGTGILGFILSMIAMLFGIWYFRFDLDPFYLCFTVLIFSSFLVENTIQRSYSTGFYLFFSLLGIAYMYEKQKRPSE